MISSLSYVNFVPKFIKTARFEYFKLDELICIDIYLYRDPDGLYYVDQLCNGTLIYDHDSISDLVDAILIFHNLCDHFILC